jgi:hypothetical protein
MMMEEEEMMTISGPTDTQNNSSKETHHRRKRDPEEMICGQQSPNSIEAENKTARSLRGVVQGQVRVDVRY